MDTIIKYLVELFKKYWRSLFGLFIGVLLIVILFSFLDITYKLYICLSCLFLWGVIWFFSSGRIILPSNKRTIVFSIKTDDQSLNYYQKVFYKLQQTMDTYKLNKKINIYNISPDIINNTKQAEKYRINQNVDLIIWGNAFHETEDKKDLINFNLKYTYRINRKLQAKLTLFNLDLSLIAGTRDWTIKLDNTRSEEIKVVNNFVEAGIFVVGVYLLTDNNLIDAIEVFSKLRILISTIKNDRFKVFIQGRINSLICETNYLLGLTEKGKGNYEEAKQYFLKIIDYPIYRFRLFIHMGILEYFVGNLDRAKDYTKQASKIHKNHPVIFFNNAFFRILAEKYDGALFWYKKVDKLPHIDVNVPELLEFLHDRLTENKKELAYTFATGIINYRFLDRQRGLSDLSIFISKAKNKPKYNSLIIYAKEIMDAEKYKRKLLKKKKKKLFKSRRKNTTQKKQYK